MTGDVVVDVANIVPVIENSMDGTVSTYSTSHLLTSSIS